jgi:hypothetical protein
LLNFFKKKKIEINVFFFVFSQAPSAPYMNFSSQPFDLFLGSEWVLMEEEGANEGMLRQFSQKETISLARKGSENR